MRGILRCYEDHYDQAHIHTLCDLALQSLAPSRVSAPVDIEEAARIIARHLSITVGQVQQLLYIMKVAQVASDAEAERGKDSDAITG